MFEYVCVYIYIYIYMGECKGETYLYIYMYFCVTRTSFLLEQYFENVQIENKIISSLICEGRKISSGQTIFL